MRARHFFHFAILILWIAIAHESFGQAQSEVRTGCLINGKTAGTFVLVDEVTGLRTAVTGTDLAKYTEGGGSRVNLTGTMTKQGTNEVFEVASVEKTRDVCAPFAYSAENQKFELGKARFGIRGGLGLDPELVIIGGQAQLGPLLKGIWFRPTAEFGFGEVTKIFSVNADLAYYLPFTGVGKSPGNRWNVYVGGGPAGTVLRRDFKGFPNEPFDIEDDWDAEVGVNFIFGVVQTSGLFVELRAAAYNTPDVRLYIGYVFH